MAISTIKVSGRVGGGFKTDIDCSNPFVIDQPKAAGGENAGPNPLEIFLSSFAGCICAIGRIIANQRKLEIRNICADVEGDIDKDFLLGKTEEGRAGFTEIRAKIEIDADMSEDEKEALAEEIEQRCPIADNIKEVTKVESTVVSSVNS